MARNSIQGVAFGARRWAQYAVGVTRKVETATVAAATARELTSESWKAERAVTACHHRRVNPSGHMVRSQRVDTEKRAVARSGTSMKMRNRASARSRQP